MFSVPKCFFLAKIFFIILQVLILLKSILQSLTRFDYPPNVNNRLPMIRVDVSDEREVC